MGVIGCQFLGRLGNQMFQYAFCRSYAERHGLTLQTGPWAGQRIFEINDPPIDPKIERVLNEFAIVEGMEDFLYRSYSQQQRCLTYTRQDALRWFKFRKQVTDPLDGWLPNDTSAVLGHRRMGDYQGYGYPVVSGASYHAAVAEQGFPPNSLVFVTEESALVHPKLTDELACVPDFVRLVRAPVILRGNSSFSWWAATLSKAKVFSPVIEGLIGGREHDVKFVEGNWPRFANLEFTTDLRLRDEP